MAWIKMTNSESGRQGFYNTDNILEIVPGRENTRVTTIASIGKDGNTGLKTYHVVEQVEDIMDAIEQVSNPSAN